MTMPAGMVKQFTLRYCLRILVACEKLVDFPALLASISALHFPPLPDRIIWWTHPLLTTLHQYPIPIPEGFLERTLPAGGLCALKQFLVQPSGLHVQSHQVFEEQESEETGQESEETSDRSSGVQVANRLEQIVRDVSNLAESSVLDRRPTLYINAATKHLTEALISALELTHEQFVKLTLEELHGKFGEQPTMIPCGLVLLCAASDHLSAHTMLDLYDKEYLPEELGRILCERLWAREKR